MLAQPKNIEVTL